MSDPRLLSRGPLSPPGLLDTRVRQSLSDIPSPPGCDMRVRPPLPCPPSPPERDSRLSRPLPPMPLPSPLPMSPLSHDQEQQLRISFHEDDHRPETRHSCKSGHDECLLPPDNFDRGDRDMCRDSSRGSTRDLCRESRDILRDSTRDLCRESRDICLDDIDPDDPYPSLQHVRTSASGLLRCSEEGLEPEDEGEADAGNI